MAVLLMKLVLNSHGKLILPVSDSTELFLVVWMMPFCTNQRTPTVHAQQCYQLSQAKHLVSSYTFHHKLLAYIFHESEVTEFCYWP